MSPLVVFVAVLVFTLLTVGYVKGIRTVARYSPDNLVRFHFIMAAVRFIFAITAVGIFALLSPSREETMPFAALIRCLGLTRLVVTIIFRQ